MDENKKGFNTLYLVLGVSTLVVAIIGATFAFFSASQTDDNITGNIAEAGGLVLDVTSITYDADNALTGNNIIPLNLITNQTENEDGTFADAEDQFDDAIAGGCVDSLGNNICEVYRITVTNTSVSSAVQVRGTLDLTGNTANMYWMQVNATTTSRDVTVGEGEEAITNTFDVLNTATKINGISTPVKQGAITGNYLTVDETGAATNLSLAANGTETYYVIVWLEEMGTAQENEDATIEETLRTYKGTVTFDAVDANGSKSGVTATFTS